MGKPHTDEPEIPLTDPIAEAPAEAPTTPAESPAGDADLDAAAPDSDQPAA